MGERYIVRHQVRVPMPGDWEAYELGQPHFLEIHRGIMPAAEPLRTEARQAAYERWLDLMAEEWAGREPFVAAGWNDEHVKRAAKREAARHWQELKERGFE